MAGIEVGGVLFKSKSELKCECKSILNSGEVGDALTGRAFKLIDGVLRLHPNYSKKVGKGSYDITRLPSQINPRNRMFYIRRAGNKGTDFSYLKCIAYPPRTTLVKDGLRSIVYPQTNLYKRRYFNENMDSHKFVVCPVTYLKITWRDAHLDHYPVQFNEIVLDWANLLKLDLGSVEIQPSTSNGHGWELVDEHLSNSFHDYHLEVATYRVVLDKVNQQRSRSN